MKYVVGLGNPDKTYAATRHNIGFKVVEMAANRLARIRGLKQELWKTDRRLDAKICAYDGLEFVQPLTFMNRSGKTVRELISKRGASLQEILVVCDDVNLVFGKMRLRSSGSPGGHHGLESICAETGDQNFTRLRFGVGRPDMPKDLTDFVLGSFESDEKLRMQGLVEKAAEVCLTWSGEGFEAATQKLAKLNVKLKE